MSDSENLLPPLPPMPPLPPPPDPALAPRPAGNPFLAVLLAWLYPGLGHFYLGRRKTALLYAAIVTATFLLGLSFEGRLTLPNPASP
jgi:hypothetical protein